MLIIDNETGAMLRAIRRFGSIPGKKALQKVMYFANLENPLFSFEWNKFGPYSEELKYTFDAALMAEQIDVEPEELMTRKGQQFNMKLSQQGQRLIEAIPPDEPTENGINFAYELLNEKNPRQMELLASVHYIVSNSNSEIDPEEIYETIDLLKPNAGFTLEDVQEALAELEEFNLI